MPYSLNDIAANAGNESEASAEAREFNRILKGAFMYPYHGYRETSKRFARDAGAASSFRRVITRGGSPRDFEDFNDLIPYVTVGPWAASEYLDAHMDNSVHRDIPVLRATAQNVQTVWSSVIDPQMGGFVPTLAYAPGHETVVYVLYLTTNEFKVVIEAMPAQFPGYTEFGVLNTPIAIDLNLHWPSVVLPRAFTHVMRPLMLQDKSGFTKIHPKGAPSNVRLDAMQGLEGFTVLPEIGQYNLLERVLNRRGEVLNRLVYMLATSQPYRMAVMNRLSAMPIRFHEHIWTAMDVKDSALTFTLKYDTLPKKDSVA
jgi:hypothetical protein